MYMFPAICFNLSLYYYCYLSLSSDLENLFSKAHSVSFKSFLPILHHTNYKCVQSTHRVQEKDERCWQSTSLQEIYWVILHGSTAGSRVVLRQAWYDRQVLLWNRTYWWCGWRSRDGSPMVEIGPELLTSSLHGTCVQWLLFDPVRQWSIKSISQSSQSVSQSINQSIDQSIN